MYFNKSPITTNNQFIPQHLIINRSVSIEIRRTNETYTARVVSTKKLCIFKIILLFSQNLRFMIFETFIFSFLLCVRRCLVGRFDLQQHAGTIRECSKETILKKVRAREWAASWESHRYIFRTFLHTFKMLRNVRLIKQKRRKEKLVVR